jgi:hypothetical protein
MNNSNIERFRTEFKKIVYQKSIIKDKERFLKQLYNWDRNDSHKKAILKALSEKDELQLTLSVMLKHKSYEDWKNFSKKLSKLNSRLATSKRLYQTLAIRILDTEKEINDLIFLL